MNAAQLVLAQQVQQQQVRRAAYSWQLAAAAAAAAAQSREQPRGQRAGRSALFDVCSVIGDRRWQPPGSDGDGPS
jgi:hypothetical protein